MSTLTDTILLRVQAVVTGGASVTALATGLGALVAVKAGLIPEEVWAEDLAPLLPRLGATASQRVTGNPPRS